jgi:hypothetical protein
LPFRNSPRLPTEVKGDPTTLRTMRRLPAEEDVPSWKLHVRPPAGVCPRRFCFNLVPDGARFSPGLHAGVDEALAGALPVRGDCCTVPFGRCRRLGDGPGDGDYYEPCEPQLASAGLPWFFFIANSSQVVEGKRDQYLAEARALWGEAQ